MIAIDTNVVVRIVVDDDREQTRRGRKLIERGEVLVTYTVLLETAWVLGSAYSLGRAEVSRALRGVLGLQGVATDQPAVVSQALQWFDAGIDFADALHIAGASQADSFATFDERLLAKARKAGLPSVGPVPRA